MIKKFTRIIQTSQSRYKANLEKKNITQQCSYNLPFELEAYLKSINALIRETPGSSNTNVLYNTTYSVDLGSNLLAIIGDSYIGKPARVVFTHTESAEGGTKKFQLKKTDFANKKSEEYDWFVDLYQNNIENTNFVVLVDSDNRTITFDVELTPSIFKEISFSEENPSKYLKTGENVILYGVPGSGKSYKVKHEYLDGLEEEQHERVVFHPDYTYSDFVGQILPEKGDNGSLTYKFNPGPFTRIMEKAYKAPDKKFVLVIEEINRGNAPAIFGDIFQLLDREKEGDEEGFSEYSITNHEIGRELFDNEDAKIKIPSNLSIIATMNTSDQNVFTLDNAFQRRWKMVQVANVFDKSKKEEKDLAETKVLDTDLIWEDFMKIINEQILNKNITMTSMEDKRLGTHFVDKNLLKDDRQFSGKVLKYLWDDGFKFARNDVFNSEFKTLEDLTEKFISNSGMNRLDIFNESVKKAIDEYLEDIKNRNSEDDGENS